MLELAMTLATDSTLREQLQNDREHLGKIKAESTKYNVTVALRNDTVQVSREFVRYNDRRLSCADIIAIRFGISKSYTNGIQTECSYLIGLASASSGLSIECNRFMRGEDKVMRDFNCILESLFHHVVPGVVSRVAASIRAGKPYQMEECVLTSKGVKFSTGVLLWKKEHFLPWSDVRSTNSRGSLIVSSARDPNIAVSYSLRAVYNAVVFEFIAKAVANGK
jgi:hypothetical protein